MAKERDEVNIIGPTNIIPGRDELFLEFAVSGGSDEGRKKALKEFAELTGGNIMEEIPLDNQTPSSSFATGFNGKHPNKATWKPNPIWKRDRKTDD
jgi:hypothetical protein